MDILWPMLELAVVVPCAVLCYLPMKGYMKIRPFRLASWGIPALFVWAAAGGAVCWLCGCSSKLWMFPSLIGFAVFFLKTVDLSAWKSMSVFLAVCAGMSSTGNIAIVIDAIFDRYNHAPWLTLPAAGIYVLMCWVLMAIVWYPATHAARWLLSEMEVPSTWYVFWILPVILLTLNLVIQPQDYETLYTNRVMIAFPLMVLALLGMLLFCYFMFYLLACGLGKNMRLQKENGFLQLQAAQYCALRHTIRRSGRRVTICTIIPCPVGARGTRRFRRAVQVFGTMEREAGAGIEPVQKPRRRRRSQLLCGVFSREGDSVFVSARMA